jgi:hypothetical protein
MELGIWDGNWDPSCFKKKKREEKRIGIREEKCALCCFSGPSLLCRSNDPNLTPCCLALYCYHPSWNVGPAEALAALDPRTQEDG